MTKISKPDQVFDVRLVHRHINAGVTTKKDYDQFVKGLPDAADNVDYVTKEMVFDLEEDQPSETSEATDE